MSPRPFKADPEYELHALLKERDVRCPGCGYALRGLAEPKCPECGQTATLEELRWGLGARRQRRRGIALAAFAFSSCAAWAVAALFLEHSSILVTMAGVVAVFVIGVPMALWRRGRRQGLTEERRAADRRFAIAMLLIGLMMYAILVMLVFLAGLNWNIRGLQRFLWP